MVLLKSHYYKKWYEFAELRQSTKNMYTSHLIMLENFMFESGFKEDEKLDFDKFYYIEETNEYEGIDIEFIDKSVENLKKQGKTVHVLYLYIESIKSFFTFLETIGLILKNPLYNYPNPYYKREVRDRSLSTEQCRLMLEAAYKMDPFFGQLYVLVFLMLVCGLRAKEVCNLRKSQINLEHNIIEITRGQKTSQSTVFITHGLSIELKRYLSHPSWQNWSNGKDKEVFFYKNKPLCYTILHSIIKKIAENAGIKRAVTPHDLRYSSANLLLESGVNIKTIQRQLRHKKITTTQLYLPPTIEIRRALECYTDQMEHNNY